MSAAFELGARSAPAVLVRAAAVAAGVALLCGAEGTAQESVIQFTVSGSSTVRGWTCTVPGTVRVTRGSAPSVPGLDGGVQAAALTVRVSDFVCPEDEMREHLLEAMRAEEFPEITFRLARYEPGGQGALTTGELTILDTSREVSFPLSLTPSGSGARLEGELQVDMTDYGVEPPVVMLGLLRVRPEIRIQFSGTVAG